MVARKKGECKNVIVETCSGLLRTYFLQSSVLLGDHCFGAVLLRHRASIENPHLYMQYELGHAKRIIRLLRRKLV